MKKFIDYTNIISKLPPKTAELLIRLQEGRFTKLNREAQRRLVSASKKECLNTIKLLKQDFTDSQADSIDVYCSSEYEKINDGLRKGHISSEYKAVVDDLNDILNKNVLNDDIVVYRGTRGVEKIDKAFKSVSINLYSAYNFSRTDDATINAYLIPKDTKYIYVGGGEYELILPPMIDLERYKITDND